MKFKIGVISDTHLISGADLSASLLDELSYMYMIFHLGDIVTMDVLYELEQLADVIAVSGNMDRYDVRAQLPEKRIITVEGVRFGLMHGSSAAKNLEDRVYKYLLPDNLDVMLFGHSHIPYSKDKNGVLLFNPGSAKEGNYGIIEVENGKVAFAALKTIKV